MWLQVSQVQLVTEVNRAKVVRRVRLDSRDREDQMDLPANKDLRDRQDSLVQLVIPAVKDRLEVLAFVVILGSLDSLEKLELVDLTEFQVTST